MTVNAQALRHSRIASHVESPCTKQCTSGTAFERRIGTEIPSCFASSGDRVGTFRGCPVN